VLLGTVPHAPGAVVRGDVRDGTAWIVADEEAGANAASAGDWSSALWRVRAGEPVTRILGRVVRAGRPLASANGAVYVERGRVGPPPTVDEAKRGLLRVDSITVDSFDPKTNATTTLYASQAYALHLAGERGGELLVYRVAPEGASLIAIDEASGASRVVCALMPFARDFSIDDAHGAIVLSNRDPADAHTWTVERIDLATGLRTRLHAARGAQPAALALPHGDVAFTADGRRGLTRSAGGAAWAPLGAGFDAPTLATHDGALVAIEHREAGAFDRTAVIDVASGRAVRLGGDERRRRPMTPRSRARGLLLTMLGVLVVLAPAPDALAYCPSYTPAETAGGQNCGVDPVPGQDPSIAGWQQIFASVAPGEASWGANGPAGIGTIGAGCGKPNAMTSVPAHFPCHVLYAITMVESGWRQFCVPDTPAASVGAPSRTIVSFDCGYGIGQVTSGMHVGETPAFDRTRVAGEAEYNLATGTFILASKWRATNCVGDNDPDLVEDWYTAIWAYNGLAYSNNPNNPNLTAGRGVYDPANGGSYAYQEKVFGWMEHPPADGRWAALAPAYPDRAEIGSGGSPPALSEPSCASPTDCTSTRSTHVSACTGAAADGGAGDAAPDAMADASADAGTGGDGGGCSCRQGGEGSGAGGAGDLALVMGAVAGTVLRRRRRRAHAPAT
jgi:hypothetical protein